MKRGQDEDEGERIRRGNEKADDAECEQSCTVPRQPFLRADFPLWQQAGASHDPARAGEQDECEQRAARPCDGAQWRRVPVRRPPEAERAENEEDGADPGPEAEPAAVATERRCDADAPPAAAGEEVDSSGEKRQQHGDEHDLDRPAANQSLAEEDVTRRALRERDALLHRVDRVLGREPDLAEASDVELPTMLLARGWPSTGRRDGNRRDSAADERRLLVRIERKREAGELLHPARP